MNKADLLDFLNGDISLELKPDLERVPASIMDIDCTTPTLVVKSRYRETAMSLMTGSNCLITGEVSFYNLAASFLKSFYKNDFKCEVEKYKPAHFGIYTLAMYPITYSYRFYKDLPDNTKISYIFTMNTGVSFVKTLSNSNDVIIRTYFNIRTNDIKIDNIHFRRTFQLLDETERLWYFMSGIVDEEILTIGDE